MKLFKSKAGFTLIELLVVIGILAVLAAIAIPSVAGLIDRANVSADKTNSNEMTNAIERFASEYELYCQDIASGALDPNNLDSAQGRVKNVVGVTTRAGIEDLEIGQDETVAENVIAIYRDTKYPVNAETMKKVVENYTKTSSSTFEPKQSDMHYWYSPDCGVVVFAEPDALSDKENKLNAQIQSGMDAKGNDLGPTTQWIDLTLGAALSGNAGGNTPPVTPEHPELREGYLSGVWVFNTYPELIEGLSENVEFTSCGEKYTYITIINMGNDSSPNDREMYYSDDENETATYTHWGSGERVWCSSSYKTVDFGTTEQQVSTEFWNWFTANATKQS